MKIKKPLITRIVGNRHACSLLIAIVFLFAETGYSADGSYLRVPVGDRERLGEALRKVLNFGPKKRGGQPSRASKEFELPTFYNSNSLTSSGMPPYRTPLYGNDKSDGNSPDLTQDTLGCATLLLSIGHFSNLGTQSDSEMYDQATISQPNEALRTSL